MHRLRLHCHVPFLRDLLLQHVLHYRTGMRVAVIVNDMAEVNVDAGLVKDQGTLSEEFGLHDSRV